MLGEKFSLIPSVMDQFGHETTTYAYMVLFYDGTFLEEERLSYMAVGPSWISLDDYTRNNLIYIKCNDSNAKNFHLGLFFNNVSGYRYGYAAVKIEVTPCKLGFVYNRDDQICECVEKGDHGYLFCPNTSVACIRSGYWFGKFNSDCNYTYSPCNQGRCNQDCPTKCPNSPDYCLISNFNNSDDLCFLGRGGFLCSKCREDYALTFEALHCV